VSEISGSPAFDRKETFLARYPRKTKLVVTGCLTVLLLAFFFTSGKKTAFVRPPTPVNTAESSSPELTRPAAPSSFPLSADPYKPGPSDPNAIAANDKDDRAARMAHAPDYFLTEDTSEGGLPKVSLDGRKPWQVYARPFNTSDKRPRLALVITDMGLSAAFSDAALRRLPANVTMVFDTQSPVLGAWLGRARQDGHETLLAVPMEPFDYPRSDPGPNTLLTNLPNSDNLRRLYWSLRRGTGYIGVTTLSGSRFTTTPSKITPILEELKDRGLMVFDARVAPHSVLKDLARQLQLPVAMSTLQIDQTLSPDAIDAALNQLEQTARHTGHAVGVAAALPVTLERLEPWVKQLSSRGIALAPLSAMVE